MFPGTGLMSMRMLYSGTSGRFFFSNGHIPVGFFQSKVFFQNYFAPAAAEAGAHARIQGGTAFPPQDEDNVNFENAHFQN
ncbi:hypothetical protein [Desulfovibrio fairfieldensis]|uniref:Uncharacterized protein n=1 Tax=Desulfovibrio fairfieldensis TaxID=44742 RepID=A0A0X8JM05_9BACT|nr:hypothetical protein [Desulfovibrio fairfieldensis]AMD90868.1 hypothetical protein AXF13_12455 [Desulfovibrio fairfieldensis]